MMRSHTSQFHDDRVTWDLCGYDIFDREQAYCIDSIVQWLKHGDRCRWLACMNPHSYAVAHKDRTFAAALQDADWLIPDGAGIVLASRLLNGSVRTRITGSDIFLGVNESLNGNGNGGVFFLGSTRENLDAMCDRMTRDYPHIRIAGTYSPPFKPVFSPEDTDRMIEEVNSARADVLWVGMTAPKQELWIHQNRDRLQVKFAGAVGAAFDFFTGRVKRSHPVFQRIGLEWLPRLIREPRRLWRRTLVSAPIFLWHALSAKFKNGH